MQEIKIQFCGFYSSFNPEENFILDILRKYYVVTVCDNPDFLFYSCFSYEHLKYTNCVKIFFTDEAVTPDFNECDYAIGFDYLDFGKRYMRHNRYVERKNIIHDSMTTDVIKSFFPNSIYSNNPHYSKKEIELHYKTPNDLTKRYFCNFIYSNDSSGYGAALRIQFCKMLMRYKHVDCPGKILNNMKYAIIPRESNWVTGKYDFIKQYKFTIAFENCSMPGYVTEKIMQPLEVGSIPIYWGDPEISREFNTKAFINCHDFDNFDHVIEYVQYLDNNDDAYLEMVQQPPMRDDCINDPDKFEKFLTALIKNGNKPISKDPRNYWDTKKRKIKELLHDACLFQMKKQNYEKAEEYALLALSLQNKLLWPYTELLNIYAIVQNNDSYEQLISQMLSIHSVDTQVLKTYATVFFDRKEYENALIVLHNALLLNNDLLWPYIMQKNIQIAQEKHENDVCLSSDEQNLNLIDTYMLRDQGLELLKQQCRETSDELAKKENTIECTHVKEICDYCKIVKKLELEVAPQQGLHMSIHKKIQTWAKNNMQLKKSFLCKDS